MLHHLLVNKQHQECLHLQHQNQQLLVQQKLLVQNNAEYGITCNAACCAVWDDEIEKEQKRKRKNMLR